MSALKTAVALAASLTVLTGPVQTPTSAAVVASNTTITVATANIGRTYHSVAVPREAMRRAAATRADIIGWQEIDEADPTNEHFMLADTFAAPWKHSAYGSLDPISTRGFTRVNVFKSAGSAAAPGVSPQRWVNGVDLDTDQDGRADLRVLNVHFVGGAWKGSMERQIDRRPLWYDTWRPLKFRVNQGHRNRLDVVVTMDANRDWDSSMLHPKAVVLKRYEVDHVLAVPAPGHRVIRGASGGRDLGVDGHPVLWATVTFA